MPDTRRSKSTLQTSHLENNTSKNITPQDVRDFCESVHPENTCQSGPIASEPSSGLVTGDQYWPTDGVYVERYNGSAWKPWGPVFPLVKPVDSDFAWVNQGSATLTATNGCLFIKAPSTGNSSTASINLLKKSAPATPYSVTAIVLPLVHATNFARLGVLWRQSSDGKIVTFEIQHNGTATPRWQLRIVKWTNPTTFSADYSATWPLTTIPWPLFLRITDNGTNRVCSLSSDGRNFIDVHSVGRTDFLTADEVGFFVNNQTGAGSSDIGATLISWAQE